MKFISTLGHLFTPRHSNNHKARLIHTEIILAIGIFLLVLQGFINTAASSKIAILGYASNISIDEVVRLTNQKRTEAGVSALTINPDLSAAALQKGQDMIANDYWAHVSPSGTEPWDFFANVGYTYRYAGENLARDFSNPIDAVNAWMASPSHRDNLLSSKYEEIGIGVVEGDMNGVDTTVIVQLFGTRSGQPAAVPEVAAETTQEEIAVEEVQTEPVQIEETTSESPDSENIPSVEEFVPSTNINKPTPFSATKYISLAVLGLLSIVLVIDIFEVERRGITRVSGRNTAHLAYIVVLILIVLISKAGEIL